MGYRVRLDIPGRNVPIYVIGLDSAWLAGDDGDAGQLRLTEDQLGLLCLDQDGVPLPGFRLALMHHPLGDLADGQRARSRLADWTDLLLRGHQHSPLALSQIEPGRTVRELAAGCLYEGTHGHEYSNAIQVVDVVLNERGRPMRYDVRFRAWSPAGHWYDDGALYREARGGRLSWVVADDTAQMAPPAGRQPMSMERAHASVAEVAAMSVSTAALRERLESEFSEIEFAMLIADTFPEVRGGLDGMVASVHPLPYRIHQAIEYCRRRGWLGRLAVAIDKVRGP